MAISRTTVVFGLVTSVAFGLAIRDTIRGTSSRAAVALVASEVEAEAQLAELEHDLPDGAEAPGLDVTLRSVLGATTATLAPELGGARLGSTGAERDAHAEHLDELDVHNLTVEHFGERSLHTVVLTPTFQLDACQRLLDAVAARWGTPVYGAHTQYWIDSAAAARAVRRTVRSACDLRLEMFASPAAWISRSRDATVPMWAVGRPVGELQTHLAERVTVDLDGEATTDDAVAWSDVGIGPLGRGRSELAAHVVDGTVVALTARADVAPDTSSALVRHLDDLFGPSSGREVRVWKQARLSHSRTGPRIQLEHLDGVQLTVGTIPE